MRQKQLNEILPKKNKNKNPTTTTTKGVGRGWGWVGFGFNESLESAELFRMSINCSESNSELLYGLVFLFFFGKNGKLNALFKCSICSEAICTKWLRAREIHSFFQKQTIVSKCDDDDLRERSFKRRDGRLREVKGQMAFCEITDF